MPRGKHPHNRLTDVEVRQAPPGRHADGNGLYIRVQPSGSRSWVQRITIHGERVDRGLGPYPVVTLAEARDLALDNRRVVRKGGDPFAARVKVKSVREALEGVIVNPGRRSAASERK